MTYLQDPAMAENSIISFSFSPMSQRQAVPDESYPQHAVQQSQGNSKLLFITHVSKILYDLKHGPFPLIQLSDNAQHIYLWWT